jgi:hypothetical protein
MKKLLPFFSVALLLAACNSTPKNTITSAMAPAEPQAQVTMAADTTGLAQFQEWKVQNELSAAEDYAKPVQAVAAVKKISRAKKVQPRPVPVSLPAPVENNTASLPQGSGSEAGSESGTINSESGDEAKATQKEGISKAAKGAVIGGIAGAGAGAVINKKNRVVGAVVGAVIGAGGGYVLGRKMDKKDGRY